VAWQFAGRDPEAWEKIALRVIAFSFFGLAAYVTVDAIRALVGLVLDSVLGWSWADLIAGFFIAAVPVKEGIDGWKGDACCTP
jgi:divalent metal cation (Fe/Co/Zn/Cd) transporter